MPIAAGSASSAKPLKSYPYSSLRSCEDGNERHRCQHSSRVAAITHPIKAGIVTAILAGMVMHHLSQRGRHGIATVSAHWRHPSACVANSPDDSGHTPGHRVVASGQRIAPLLTAILLACPCYFFPFRFFAGFLNALRLARVTVSPVRMLTHLDALRPSIPCLEGD